MSRWHKSKQKIWRISGGMRLVVEWAPSSASFRCAERASRSSNLRRLSIWTGRSRRPHALYRDKGINAARSRLCVQLFWVRSALDMLTVDLPGLTTLTGLNAGRGIFSGDGHDGLLQIARSGQLAPDGNGSYQVFGGSPALCRPQGHRWRCAR